MAVVSIWYGAPTGMGLGAILLGVFSFVCMFGGAILTPIPFVGTMLSFLSPLLAIGGIVLGGVAISRAKQHGDQDSLGVAGLVVNIVAFVPAMVVALTCGLCNTLCTGAMLTPRDPNAPSLWDPDAGPSPWDLLFVDGGVPSGSDIHAPGANVPPAPPPDPMAAPAPAPDPNAVPPPPLPPGPTATPPR